MKNKHLILYLCILLGLSTNAPAQSLDIEDNIIAAISQHYSQYDSFENIWIWEGQDSEYTGILSLHRIDRLSIHNHEYVYVLLRGGYIDEDGNPVQARFSPGIIGAFIFENQKGNIKTIAYAEAIDHGSFGIALEDWQIIALNSTNYYGWLSEPATYCSNGICIETRIILAPHNGVIKDIMPDAYLGFSNEGTGEDVQSELNYTLRLVGTDPASRVFPLSITLEGELDNKPYHQDFIFEFDTSTWQYQIPEEWPLILKKGD